MHDFRQNLAFFTAQPPSTFSPFLSLPTHQYVLPASSPRFWLDRLQPHSALPIMEDIQGIGLPYVLNGPPAAVEWPAQELLDVPEALLFTSDLPNSATHHHHHDGYDILPAAHLTPETQTFGHDTAMHITRSSGLLAGHLTFEAQNFGYDTTMHITKNQNHPFPENHDVCRWDFNPPVVAGDSASPFENLSQKSAREHPSYKIGVVNASPLYLPAYSEQKGSSLQECGIYAYKVEYASPEERTNHLHRRHDVDYTCHQCTKKFMTMGSLETHIWATGHLSFTCKHENCGKRFSRMESYQRHERKHREDAKRFPCKYCRKYRGNDGFTRKDHLTQHVRNYHHIDEDNGRRARQFGKRWCRILGCSHHWGFAENLEKKKQGLLTSAEYIQHMRTIHDESDFPCPQPGCDRINGKGYFRKADLRSHLRKVHGTDGSLEDYFD